LNFTTELCLCQPKSGLFAGIVEIHGEILVGSNTLPSQRIQPPPHQCTGYAMSEIATFWITLMVMRALYL